ncbi:hypothetical protein LTR66_006684 [Elasticomyces elasticus]|nr:hypothetical protein LTR66_006684 [Elasticomyces elasticus]
MSAFQTTSSSRASNDRSAGRSDAVIPPTSMELSNNRRRAPSLWSSNLGYSLAQDLVLPYRGHSMVSHSRGSHNPNNWMMPSATYPITSAGPVPFQINIENMHPSYQQFNHSAPTPAAQQVTDAPHVWDMGVQHGTLHTELKMLKVQNKEYEEKVNDLAKRSHDLEERVNDCMRQKLDLTREVGNKDAHIARLEARIQNLEATSATCGKQLALTLHPTTVTPTTSTASWQATPSRRLLLDTPATPFHNRPGLTGPPSGALAYRARHPQASPYSPTPQRPGEGTPFAQKDLATNITVFFHSIEGFVNVYCSLPAVRFSRSDLSVRPFMDAACNAVGKKDVVRDILQGEHRHLVVVAIIARVMVCNALIPHLFDKFPDRRGFEYAQLLKDFLCSEAGDSANRWRLIQAMAACGTIIMQDKPFWDWLYSKIDTMIIDITTMIEPLVIPGQREAAVARLRSLCQTAFRLGARLRSEHYDYEFIFPMYGEAWDPNSMISRDKMLVYPGRAETHRLYRVRMAITPVVMQQKFDPDELEILPLHRGQMLLANKF